MKYTLIAAGLAALVVASPTPEKRQTSGPCFHEPSTALCCPDTGDQLLVSKCSTPGNTSDPCAFQASCTSVKLQAYCCQFGNTDSGLICAPSGDSPFGDPYNCTTTS